MSISFNRYVNITSGVGAGTAVAQRQLIARLFTVSPEVPVNTVMEFTDLADVGNTFGTTTQEYLRAQFYFAFISKTATRPQRISFARWGNAAVAPYVFGGEHADLATLQAITAGQFSVTIGATTETFTGIDLSGAGSLTAVATAIQTAVQTGTGVAFTGATVTYNATNERFELVSGETAAVDISIAAGAANDVAGPLGWLSGTTVSSGLAAAQTVTQALTETTEATNNFGSFRFIPALTQAQVVEAATWNDAQNVLFQFHHGVVPADAAALSAAVLSIGGTALTLLSTVATNDYPEMIPMAALAATVYSRPNSTINFMFQQASGVAVTVNTTADANLYDGLRINYYGNTQTAGQMISFYQRGVMMGIGTDPLDMNTYANEQWLKDRVGQQLMELLLNVKVPANPEGRAQALGSIRPVIEEALANGTIQVGRTLTAAQQTFITTITDDPLAYHQVNVSGYWLDAAVQPDTMNPGQFIIEYTLIYTKDDVVRRVDGSHILI